MAFPGKIVLSAEEVLSKYKYMEYMTFKEHNVIHEDDVSHSYKKQKHSHLM